MGPRQLKLHVPTFGEEEIQAAVDVMRSTMVTQGSKVREFEKAFWPHSHSVASNSGSSANLLAIAALKSRGLLNDYDEVIVSALSWSTTAWPLVQHNLVPVFVDCNPFTLNMDVTKLERAITPSTKAIMPVHVYGNPCDMGFLTAFCDERGLILIEDCCEAMGATYDGKPVGSFGSLGTFSFYFSHHLTTLEGGITVTPHPLLADTMRIQRSHGWIRDVEDRTPYERYGDFDPRFLFVDSGYNLRLNEVQAAIGLVQVPKLQGFVQKRRAAHDGLNEALGMYEYFRFQEEVEKGLSSCFGFNITLNDAPFSASSAAGIQRELRGQA